MSRKLSFLLITSDEVTSSLVVPAFESEGHRVFSVTHLKGALSALGGSVWFDAVLFDNVLQDLKTLPLLKVLVERVRAEKLWLITALGRSLWKEEADGLGVQHVLWRPLQRHDLERVLDQVSDAVSTQIEMPASAISLGSAPKTPYYLEDLPNDRYFLAACPSMMKLYDTVRLLAAVDVPVLILGESGVGKDVVANLLHKHSLRSNGSYTSVNCAALPPDLLESELFGYEAGAFTGAVKAKPGKFELADHGTLLLDEIGEMTAPMQAKLLHVLQDGRFSRLGARTTTQVDVRVVAATNINIEDAIATSAFRQDLYYRISAFTINIPPLRERKAEIPYLVEQMLKRHAANFRQTPVYISPEVIEAMQAYHWPGNLRELSNYVVRMQVLQETDATLADLTAKVRGVPPAERSCPRLPSEELHGVEDMRMIVRNFKDQTESRLIQEALDGTGWNRRHAAAELRISYRALLYKIQQYGLKNTRRLPPPRTMPGTRVTHHN
jgi:two-component system, NtrC family, response regulator AtoC